NRPNEPQAKYTVIAIGNGPEGSVAAVNSRYSDASGWGYTVRAVKCETGRMKTLGYGDTIEKMNASSADPKWGPLIGGSSATQVSEIACRESGKQLVGLQ